MVCHPDRDQLFQILFDRFFHPHHGMEFVAGQSGERKTFALAYKHTVSFAAVKHMPESHGAGFHYQFIVESAAFEAPFFRRTGKGYGVVGSGKVGRADAVAQQEGSAVCTASIVRTGLKKP